MNYDKSSLRFLIETCRRNDFSAIQTHEFISNAWPQAVTLRRVRQILQELTEGEACISDSRGRPRTARTDENMRAVEECALENPTWSVEAISAATGISSSTVHRILTEELLYQWKLARWLPHHLSEEQKVKRVSLCKEILKTLKKHDSLQKLVIVDEKIVYHFPINNKQVNAAWVPPNGDQPTVCRRTQFSPKTMVVVAITFTGKVLVQCVERGKSIDSNAYIAFLQRVFHNFSRHTLPIAATEMLLMHDNARVHTSHSVDEFLQRRGVTVIHQPPYSPDTNALDRFAFKIVEEQRHNITFESSDQVEKFVTDTLKSITLDHLQNEYQKLQGDLKAIIDNGGDYL